MEPARRLVWVRRLGVTLVAMTFVLMVLGSWVKATGSGLACPDWPRCYGEWLPPFPSADNGGTWDGEPVTFSTAQVMYEWGHRLLASLLGVPILAFVGLVWAERRFHPTLRALAPAMLVVLGVQAAIGGQTVIQGNPAPVTTLHLATATMFFFLTTLAAVYTYLRPWRGAQVGMAAGTAGDARAADAQSSAPDASAAEAQPGSGVAGLAAGSDVEPAPARPVKAVLKDYMEISKPRIILLLLIVAWAAMAVAARGLPAAEPFIAVTLAGTFSTAASGAFNNVIERKRDSRMGRTAKRPVASGRISPGSAVVYGATMSVLALISLVLIGAWLATLLTAAAIAYYVIVYTVWLKPSTPQNIVIGGLAGSFPALIGWSAVTGGLGWPSFVIAAIVFLWTPAHFWALALLYKKDYAAADYPMLPNVVGEQSTRRLILVYSVLTVLASLALVYPYGDAGLVYLVAGMALGLLLVLRAARLETRPSPKAYRGFFLFTIQYLGFLLVALIVDQVAYRSVI